MLLRKQNIPDRFLECYCNLYTIYQWQQELIFVSRKTPDVLFSVDFRNQHAKAETVEEQSLKKILTSTLKKYTTPMIWKKVGGGVMFVPVHYLFYLKVFCYF